MTHQTDWPLECQSFASRAILCFLVTTACVFLPSEGFAHDGPDPIYRWRFERADIDRQNSLVQPRLGPIGRIVGNYDVLDETPAALFLQGKQDAIVISDDAATLESQLPSEAMTIAAWVSVDKRQTWGGIVGAFQDNGASEAGWVLGYNESSFTFGLAGADGPGRLTYLAGKTRYELGKTYHVVAVYDGDSMQLYVNGQLDAESEVQSGAIRYPEKIPFTLGAYRDADEFFGMRGRLIEIAVYAQAAKPEWAEHDYSHNAIVAQRPARPIYEPLAFAIEPYLQFGTQSGMTVMWKTNRPASTKIFYGETSKCEQSIELSGERIVHEIRLNSLQAETQYFYRTESSGQTDSQTIASEPCPFQTAVQSDTPFAFAVISDTQGNPTVSGKLAEFAWGQRPNFLLHPGDLVSTGPNDAHWTEHFFPSMNPLIRHVPFFPVLGNHEQNAKNYFDYVSLPTPEYYYTFEFGNAQFFMIDTNRNVSVDSEQYRWLAGKLAESQAQWKIVCHHHPPYSSDENDYGNLWKTNKSSRGDLRARVLVQLYEKFGVDIVWNGHIHSYERTWPVKSGRAVVSNAPIYMITGGGGGGLETPGPIRPFFQNTVRRGHHYAMVRVNGSQMEIQVYDLDNRLFDSLVLDK